MKQIVFMMAITVAIACGHNLHAQVTIGSGLPPNKGALLDIKEEADKSTKGLLLPRVNLTSKQNLYPMFIQGEEAYKGSKKTDEDANHIGMIVYNLSEIGQECLYPGIYIWGGNNWTALSGEGKDNVCNIDKVTCRAQDSLALVALYKATDGANWTNNTNWLSSKPISEWYGVACEKGVDDCQDQLRVKTLDLHENNLAGTLPPEIGKLTEITYLSLAHNKLTGSIPPEIGKLTKLTLVSFVFNQLTGTIPPEIGNMKALEIIYWNDNQLTGSIPPEIGDLESLRWLHLQANKLTGSIPREIGKLVKLQSIAIFANQLTGAIPSEIGELTKLIFLHLDGNQLSGSIPPEIGKLESLELLFLQHNQLAGTIPPEMGKMTNVNTFQLNNNKLGGTIPAEMANLTKLFNIRIENNRLSGYLPDNIINATENFVCPQFQSDGTTANPIPFTWNGNTLGGCP